VDSRSSRGLCAYAITREHTLGPAGPVDVRLVAHRGLALVVSEVELARFAEVAANPTPLTAEPSEEDPLVMLARRHDVVTRAVFEHHPVLPLRFGTLVPDEPAAVRLLADHHAEARSWLDRVDGHREWRVRARLAHPGTPTPTSTATAAPADGAGDLAARRDRLAAAARTRRDGSAAATALHEALSRYAAETVYRTRRSASPLLDAAYLVPAAAERAFRAETGRFPGLAVDMTGPWPPYAFVRLEVTTPTEAVTRA
jgi:hypothetical protein